MIKTEAGSGPGATATVEALMNRSILTSNTIKEELNSGFYGPIKSGAAQRADMSPSDRAAAQRAIDEVGGSSNLIQEAPIRGAVTIQASIFLVG